MGFFEWLAAATAEQITNIGFGIGEGVITSTLNHMSWKVVITIAVIIIGPRVFKMWTDWRLPRELAKQLDYRKLAALIAEQHQLAVDHDQIASTVIAGLVAQLRKPVDPPA